jgi:hypothetical protein
MRRFRILPPQPGSPTLLRASGSGELVGVRPLRCTACGAELILTGVVPDDTAHIRGREHHTFICSGCHVTERRLVFTRHGREDDSVPMHRRGAVGPLLCSTERIAPRGGGKQPAAMRNLSRLSGQVYVGVGSKTDRAVPNACPLPQVQTWSDRTVRCSRSIMLLMKLPPTPSR